MNIYVGNLPYNTTEDDLQQLFGQYGAVSKVNLITDRETGNSKGFGFVEMDDEEGAEKSIQDLDGSSMSGRNIKVNQARPRTERTNQRPRKW